MERTLCLDLKTSPNLLTHNWHHHISICFSIHQEHALVDTAALVDEITAPTQEEEEDEDYDEAKHKSVLPVRVRITDRWAVSGLKNRLLFWIPPAYNLRWWPPGMRWVIPTFDAQVDLSQMAHGLSWGSCYG